MTERIEDYVERGFGVGEYVVSEDGPRGVISEGPVLMPPGLVLCEVARTDGTRVWWRASDLTLVTQNDEGDAILRFLNWCYDEDGFVLANILGSVPRECLAVIVRRYFEEV